jgi:excisionase family DNA binding protein
MKSQTVTEKPLLLTITEAGRYLGVSRSSIYRLIHEGKLKTVRPVPDAPRIARAEIEQYAEGLRSS